MFERNWKIARVRSDAIFIEYREQLSKNESHEILLKKTWRYGYGFKNLEKNARNLWKHLFEQIESQMNRLQTDVHSQDKLFRIQKKHYSKECLYWRKESEKVRKIIVKRKITMKDWRNWKSVRMWRLTTDAHKNKERWIHLAIVHVVPCLPPLRLIFVVIFCWRLSLFIQLSLAAIG